MFPATDILRALLNGIANSKTYMEATSIARLSETLARYHPAVGHDVAPIHVNADSMDEESAKRFYLANETTILRVEKFNQKWIERQAAIRDLAQRAIDLNQFILPFYKRIWLRLRGQGIYGPRAIGDPAHIDAAQELLGDWK